LPQIAQKLAITFEVDFFARLLSRKYRDSV
jgi:hypothetical protein